MLRQKFNESNFREYEDTALQDVDGESFCEMDISSVTDIRDSNLLVGGRDYLYNSYGEHKEKEIAGRYKAENEENGGSR